MKKIFSLLLPVMLLALLATACTRSPAEPDTSDTPTPPDETPQIDVQTEPPVQYFLLFSLGAGENAECVDFYGSHAAGTEIAVDVTGTPGGSVTVRFWSDDGGACDTMAGNETDGTVVLPADGDWHAEVIADENHAYEGSLLLTLLS